MNRIQVLGAMGCASIAIAAYAHDRATSAAASTATTFAAAASAKDAGRVERQGSSPVTLTLATPPVTRTVRTGDRLVVMLAGNWQAQPGTPVYIQASDSAGHFTSREPVPAGKLSRYSIGLALPASATVGTRSGQFTVRACADALCMQPYADTMHSIGYSITATGVGEWETLQRTSRHDGYVPVAIDASSYQLAWTWQRPSPGGLSPVVTDGENVYFSEPGNLPSLYALRASDGVPQWRRVFGGANALNPPTVSNGVVYAATTGHQETWLYALRGSDGMQAFQSQFFTQWANILNPTVHNGRVYLNSGYYGGVVYAFNLADGAAAWNASGGTYGMNSPAVDDQFAYVYNGTTLAMLRTSDGTLASSIGPNASGVQTDYNGTPMLGAADSVMAYSSAGYSYGDGPRRQLVNFSVAAGSARWMSFALYSNYPAVAKGVVYATSNETASFDALDEATGRVLWSWKPREQSYVFVGNVVVTDNVAFVSTKTRVYAVDLRQRRAVWSAPTPGSIALSATRMLYVTSVVDNNGGSQPGKVSAYRLP